VNLRVEPAAAVDVARAIHWYELQSPGLGPEFLRSIDACFERIQRAPEAGILTIESVRRTAVRRFPFLVFYLVESEGIVVLAVIHAARDPEWIQRRLG